MLHITIGLFLIALGVWGIFDEWYYVVDCVKGGGAMLLIVGGLVGMLAGLVRPGESLDDAGGGTGSEGTPDTEGGRQ